MAHAEAPSDTVRVLCIHTATWPPLGADTWIHAQIIRHLDHATHDVFVACRTCVGGTPTPTYEVVRDVSDIHIVPVDLGPELYGRSRVGKVRGLVATLPAVVSLVRLVLLVRRRGIGVIHTSDRPRDAFAAVIIARLTGAVSIVHVHVAYNPSWMGWMLRWSLERADALIAVSSFVGETLVAGGHAAERVHVVLNGIDVGAWEPGAGRDTARRELDIADHVPVVVIVCRLFPEKGPADLIRAVAVIRDEFDDVLLLVVGMPLDRAYGVELAALVTDLEMDGHVRFLGRRPDVHAIMAASDVFAMPSHEEPFGLVFVEAMAMRLPVVALADGGTLEVVEDGRTGLLSTWGDGDQLATNLRALLGDRDRRGSMGADGRRRAEQRFTVQRMASDVARIYRLIAC